MIDIIMILIGSQSTGPNNIPTITRNIIEKNTRNTVFLPLTKLINKSFEIGIFSDICKVARVVSIFKSETKLLCNDYRAISLLPNIGKIIQKLMR